MAFDGSGNHNLPSGNPVVTGTTISSTVHNNTMNDISSALEACVIKDGQNAATADLPMGGYNHTNVDDAAARTEYASAGQVQDGTLHWVDGGGSADAITAAYSPAITTLVDGQICYVRATTANATTTPTFSPNGLTARTIVKQGGSALLAGDIAGDGHELILRYDLSNTRWELLNPAATSQIASQAASVAMSKQGVLAPHDNLVVKYVSATTVDIDATAVLLTDSSGNQLKKAVNLTFNEANGSAKNGFGATVSAAASTWYYVYVGDDGGTAYCWLDTDSGGANDPDSTSTYKALVGMVYYNSSTDVAAFTQNNTEARWSTQVADLSGGSATTATKVDITVAPAAIKATLSVTSRQASGAGTNTYAIIYSASGGAYTQALVGGSTVNNTFENYEQIDVLLLTTDTAGADIWYKNNASGQTCNISAVGWSF